MRDDTIDRDPIDVLAEVFVELHRRGKGPTIEQYARKHAQYADEIRELFPAIVDIEKLEQQQQWAAQPQASIGRPDLQRVGDFCIVREIGRGGMGVVYEAEQQSLKRRVALKILGNNVAGSERHLQRFRREAEAAARLHHTNIVPIYGTGDVDGLHFYAMQLIDGVGLDEVIHALRGLAGPAPRGDTAANTRVGSTVQQQAASAAAHVAAQYLRDGAFSRGKSPSSSATATLNDDHPALRSDSCDEDGLIQRARPLPQRLDHRYWRTAARLARDVAQALDYAHRHGVLHRDIKPSNLLLDQEGNIWITDFGLAKHEDSDALTKTGDIVGTLRYIAPEQFQDQVTNRSDVYSLGLTLYELLTLRPTFGDSKQGPLLQSKMHGIFTLPRSLNPHVPADLETITLKASSTDPAHRYRTASELADDLQRYLDERPILARRVGGGERLWRWCRRNPAVATLGSLAIVLLMLIAALLGWSNYRAGLALDSVDEQRQRAVDAADEATRERTRAEGNLQLAVNAFEDITRNLARRGVPESLEVDLGDGEVYFDVVVTNADADLLQTLLRFFDEFARQNGTNLQFETAAAYVRMGDIHQRLGNLKKSGEAYAAALDTYERLLAADPGDEEFVLAKAESLNDLAVTLGRAGDLDSATQRHRDAEKLLREHADVMQTPAGKFELARTLNLLGSRAFRAGEDRMFGSLVRSMPPPGGGRGRGPGPGGFPGRFSAGLRPPQPRVLVDVSHSLAARELLEDLVQRDPANTDYRLALGQCFQNEIRFHRLRGELADAEAALNSAIEFLEQATRDFPKVPAFQYALADTLSLSVPGPRNQAAIEMYEHRVNQAIAIARRLVATYPNIPEYQSLQGCLQSDLAAAQSEAGQLVDAESNYQAAIEQQQALVKRYGSVSLYRLTYAQTLSELAELQRRGGQLEQARANLEEAASQVEPFAESDQQVRHVYRRFLQQVYVRLAATLRELGETQFARDLTPKIESLVDRDRPAGMGRFRFRPGEISPRGWRIPGR